MPFQALDRSLSNWLTSPCVDVADSVGVNGPHGFPRRVDLTVDTVQDEAYEGTET